MKNHWIIILTMMLWNASGTMAQDERDYYKNRVYLGAGGESSYLGADYLREVYGSTVFLGAGFGFGTGFTAYVRYEPLRWSGLSPFISSGASYAFTGTFILPQRASVFSSSVGLSYLPQLKWATIPTIAIGISYYHMLKGDINGESNGWGPLIKIGIAFP